MRALVLALALCGLVAAPAAAQEPPVTVRSEVDRAVMAIGDHVLLTIVAELAPGYDLADPGVPRAIGDFEVVETLTVLQTRGPNGASRIQLRYLITAFTLGAKQLPVIVVGYRGPAGPGEARTPAGHRIQVQTVVLPNEDTSDIKPLKPPLAVPSTFLDEVRRVAPAVALAVAIVGLLVAGVVYLRRHRRQAVVDEQEHGPARRALDELERVAGLHLPEQGRTREHYELVEAALRRYATDRYALHAASRTARELRRELERSNADRTQAQLLFDVLHDAESVRYQEQVIFPARAHKTMHDLIEVMRKSVIAEEYELIEGTSA